MAAMEWRRRNVNTNREKNRTIFRREVGSDASWK